MDRQEIIETINDLLYEEFEISEVDACTNIDSLCISRIELLSLLELRFEITLLDTVGWCTFDDIYSYLECVL